MNGVDTVSVRHLAPAGSKTCTDPGYEASDLSFHPVASTDVTPQEESAPSTAIGIWLNVLFYSSQTKLVSTQIT